jgi:hypothetical protein
MRVALLLALLIQEDALQKLVDRLAGDNLDDVRAAQAELVKKGREAKAPVQKALTAAKKELKERYEGVLLRLEAGVDETSAKPDGVPVNLEAEWFLDVPKEGTPAAAQGRKWAHLRASFIATNEGDSEKVLLVVSATLITLKERIKLLVEGPKKEPFQWTLPARMPKAPCYDNLVDPKWPVGTRAVAVFEIKIGSETVKLRTNVFELAEKK